MTSTSFATGFDLRASVDIQVSNRRGSRLFSCSPVDRPRSASSSIVDASPRNMSLLSLSAISSCDESSFARAAGTSSGASGAVRRGRTSSWGHPSVSPSPGELGSYLSGRTSATRGSVSSFPTVSRETTGKSAGGISVPMHRQVGFQLPTGTPTIEKEGSSSASRATDAGATTNNKAELKVPCENESNTKGKSLASLELQSAPGMSLRSGSPLSVLERSMGSASSTNSAGASLGSGRTGFGDLEEEAQEAVRLLREKRATEEGKLSPSERLNTLAQTYPIYREPLVTKAFFFAFKAHEGQVRKSGEPYFNHVLETSKILVEMGFDVSTVAAGLLHDTLDDTMTTFEMLEATFGSDVANLVARVSRLSELSQMLRHEGGSDFSNDKKSAYGDIMLGMSDVRAVLVKLADRLHNLQTIDALPVVKQQGLAQETLSYLTPLANRLGVWSLKAKMEDICFRVLHPEVHEEVLTAAGQQEDQSRQEIMSAIQDISDSLSSAGVEFEDISGRPKNLYSMWQKMCNKGLKSHEILDQRALRVIVKNKEDCYKALAVVNEIFTPIDGRLKDYIKTPKINGYQSIHTSLISTSGLPLEVQIRTAEMHYVAEYGLAAHWRYKEQSGKKSKGPAEGKEDILGTSYTERQIAWARFALSMYAEASKCRLPNEDGSGSVVPSSLCPFNQYKEGLGSCPHQVAGLCSNGSLCMSPASLEASAEMSDEPVVVIDKNSGCTLLKLHAGATSADLHLPARSRLLVNSQLVDSKNYQLQMGDVVEAMEASEDELGLEKTVREEFLSHKFRSASLEDEWCEDDSWKIELDFSDIPSAEGTPLSIDFEREKLGRIYGYDATSLPSQVHHRSRRSKRGGRIKRRQSYSHSCS